MLIPGKTRFALCLLLLLVLPLAACSKQTNQQVAQDVKQSATEVKDSTGQALSNLGDKLDDSSITAAVKAKILVTKGLDSLDISVQTKGGVVYLTGMVDNSAQITLAGQVASQVGGVRQVVNNLKTF